MPFISEEEIFGTSKNTGRTGFIPEDEIFGNVDTIPEPTGVVKNNTEPQQVQPPVLHEPPVLRGQNVQPNPEIQNTAKQSKIGKSIDALQNKLNSFNDNMAASSNLAEDRIDTGDTRNSFVFDDFKQNVPKAFNSIVYGSANLLGQGINKFLFEPINNLRTDFNLGKKVLKGEISMNHFIENSPTVNKGIEALEKKKQTEEAQRKLGRKIIENLSSLVTRGSMPNNLAGDVDLINSFPAVKSINDFALGLGNYLDMQYGQSDIDNINFGSKTPLRFDFPAFLGSLDQYPETIIDILPILGGANKSKNLVNLANKASDLHFINSANRAKKVISDAKKKGITLNPDMVYNTDNMTKSVRGAGGELYELPKATGNSVTETLVNNIMQSEKLNNNVNLPPEVAKMLGLNPNSVLASPEARSALQADNIIKQKAENIETALNNARKSNKEKYGDIDEAEGKEIIREAESGNFGKNIGEVELPDEPKEPPKQKEAKKWDTSNLERVNKEDVVNPSEKVRTVKDVKADIQAENKAWRDYHFGKQRPFKEAKAREAQHKQRIHDLKKEMKDIKQGKQVVNETVDTSKVSTTIDTKALDDEFKNLSKTAEELADYKNGEQIVPGLYQNEIINLKETIKKQVDDLKSKYGSSFDEKIKTTDNFKDLVNKLNILKDDTITSSKEFKDVGKAITNYENLYKDEELAKVLNYNKDFNKFGRLRSKTSEGTRKRIYKGKNQIGEGILVNTYLDNMPRKKGEVLSTYIHEMAHRYAETLPELKYDKNYKTASMCAEETKKAIDKFKNATTKEEKLTAKVEYNKAIKDYYNHPEEKYVRYIQKRAETIYNEDKMRYNIEKEVSNNGEYNKSGNVQGLETSTDVLGLDKISKKRPNTHRWSGNIRSTNDGRNGQRNDSRGRGSSDKESNNAVRGQGNENVLEGDNRRDTNGQIHSEKISIKDTEELNIDKPLPRREAVKRAFARQLKENADYYKSKGMLSDDIENNNIIKTYIAYKKGSKTVKQVDNYLKVNKNAGKQALREILSMPEKDRPFYVPRMYNEYLTKSDLINIFPHKKSLTNIGELKKRSFTGDVFTIKKGKLTRNTNLEEIANNIDEHRIKLQQTEKLIDSITDTFAIPYDAKEGLKKGYVMYNPDAIKNVYFGGKELYDDIASGIRDKLSFEESLKKAFDGNPDVLKQAKEVYESLQKGEGKFMQIPESVMKELKLASGVRGTKSKALKNALTIWDTGTDLFKSNVLGLNPKWIINNRIGNVAMGALRGHNLANPFNMLKIKKLTDDLFPDDLFKSELYKAEKAKKIPKTGIAELDSAISYLKGDKVIDSKALSIANLPQRTIRRIIDGAFKINDAMEKMDRKTVYFNKLNKEKKAILKQTGKSMMSDKELLLYAKDNPELQKKILQHVNDVLGDYSTMNKFEQGVLKRIIPFYSWFKVISKYTYKLAKDDPLRAEIASKLASFNYYNNVYEENKGLPDYQKGATKIDYVRDNDGGDTVLNYSHSIPFSSLSEGADNPTGLIHPVLGKIIEASNDEHRYNRQKFTTKRYKSNANKGFVDERNGRIVDSLPLSEKAKYVGINTLRDIVPGFKHIERTVGGSIANSIKDGKLEIKPYDKLWDTSFGGYMEEDRGKQGWSIPEQIERTVFPLQKQNKDYTPNLSKESKKAKKKGEANLRKNKQGR